MRWSGGVGFAFNARNKKNYEEGVYKIFKLAATLADLHMIVN
jgi:hypothetical protein